MSAISRLLGLKIVVEATGGEKLDVIERRLNALVRAQVALDQATGRGPRGAALARARADDLQNKSLTDRIRFLLQAERVEQALAKQAEARMAREAAARRRHFRETISDMRARGREEERVRLEGARRDAVLARQAEARLRQEATARRQAFREVIGDMRSRGREEQRIRRDIQREAAQIERRDALQERNRQRLVLTQAFGDARVARILGDPNRELAALRGALPRLTADSREFLRVQQAINETQARMAGTRGPSAFERLTAGAGRLLNVTTRLLAAFFLVEFAVRRVFSAISAVIRPVTQLLGAVIKTDDEFRKVLISLSGITGSLRSARDIQRDVRAATGTLPITTLEGLQATRGLGFIPATARSIQNPEGRVSRLNDLLGILQGLATIDPQQGIEGARFALREALAGEFRSLRFRFEVSPQIIAASIGRSLDDLRADPRLTLDAIRQFVNTFVGPEAIEEMRNLFSVQAKLFRGVLEEFFQLIGDQGIYDRATRTIRRIVDAFRGGLEAGPGSESAPLEQAARRINDALERFLDRIIQATERAVGGFIGRDVDLATAIEGADVEQLATVIADVIDALGRFAGTVTLIAGDIARTAGTVLKSVGIVGPVTPEAIQAELDALRIERARVQGQLDRNVAIFRRGSAGGAIGDELNLVSTGLISRNLDEIIRRQEDLEARLGVFRTSSRQTDPLSGIQRAATDIVSAAGESRRPLFTLTTELTNKIELALRGEKEFTDNLIGVFRIVEQTFDPGNPTSLSSLVASARETADRLERDIDTQSLVAGRAQALAAGRDDIVGRIDGALGAVKSIRDAVALTIDGAGRILDEAAIDILRAANASFKDLPPETVIRVTDQLFGGFLGGGIDRLNPAGARGLGVQSRLSVNPDTIRGLVQAVQARARAEGDLGIPSSRVLGGALGRFGDLRSGLQAEQDRILGQVGPFRPNEIEDQIVRIGEALNQVVDAERRVRQEFDAIGRAAAETASGISDSFRGAFVDGLVDAITNGAREGEKIMRNLGQAIIGILAELVLEFTLIRGILNPALNTVFGLQGTNALPTVGNASGGIHGGPLRVVDAASGFILNRPGTMLAGGGTRIRTVENGLPEAVVPLAGGGAPVRFLNRPSGLGGEVIQLTIVNTVDSPTVVRRGAARDPSVVVNPVVADMRGRGSTRREIRRIRR